MIIDNLQLFSGSSNGAPVSGVTATANTDAPTTGTQAASNIVDYGIVAGLPTSANGGGARDMGIGDDPALKFVAIATTAFAGGTSLQLQLQGAPDSGSGTPGSYTTLWTGPAVVEANLVAGARLGNIDFPRQIPGAGPLRYLKLNYITVGTHTGGAVECFIGLDEMEQILGPGSALSGYPAGINIAN